MRWTNLLRLQPFEDPLHNSLRPVATRTRAHRRVVFLANSGAIGCKKDVLLILHCGNYYLTPITLQDGTYQNFRCPTAAQQTSF